MPIPSFPNKVFLVLALAGGLLLGCSSKATTTNFYLLNPVNYGDSLADTTDREGDLSLKVASLRLPQYLERPQIVTRSGDNQLDLAEYHQWGGNLRKNMVRVLAKNLSQLLATPDITLFSSRSASPPDFRIDLEVLHFERDSDAKVRLSVQWRLSRGTDKKLLAAKITELESPAVTDGTDYGQTVTEMSALLGELSKAIGEEIIKNSAPGGSL